MGSALAPQTGIYNCKLAPTVRPAFKMHTRKSSLVLLHWKSKIPYGCL